MNRTALMVAAGWGTLAQVLLVVTGHFVAWVADYLFAPGGLLIAFAAGVIYARRAWPAPPLAGGALSAAIAAFLGILVSLLLGDVFPLILVLGTVASAVIGLGGAALGHGLAGRLSRR